jgi:hypothetical protein
MAHHLEDISSLNISGIGSRTLSHGPFSIADGIQVG